MSCISSCIIELSSVDYDKMVKRFFLRSTGYLNCTFRYIDNVLSLNSYTLGDVVDRIYPIELEIKDITDTAMYVSYLDLHIEIDSETQLRITIYEKEIISSFPLRTLYLYVATFQQHMHMEHISLKLSQSM